MPESALWPPRPSRIPTRIGGDTGLQRGLELFVGSEYNDNRIQNGGLLDLEVLADLRRRLYRALPILKELGDDSRFIVSEPLRDLPGAWNEVPDSSGGMVHRGEYEIHPFTPTLSARATQTRVNLAGVHDRRRVVAPLVFVFGWSSWSAVWSPPHRGNRGDRCADQHSGTDDDACVCGRCDPLAPPLVSLHGWRWTAA